MGVHTAKIWEFPGSGTQICFSTWWPPPPRGVYLAPLASNIPFFAGAFGAYYPSPMSCYILYFLDSGWVFSCKIVSFICFGWLLWHLWSFSSVCFYPSFLSFWLSFLMQNPVQTIMSGFCSFHDCRFLTLNTTIVGFDYWDIVLEKNDWMTHTDRDSLWDSYFGTHCWESLFRIGKSFVFS